MFVLPMFDVCRVPQNSVPHRAEEVGTVAGKRSMREVLTDGDGGAGDAFRRMPPHWELEWWRWENRRCFAVWELAKALTDFRTTVPGWAWSGGVMVLWKGDMPMWP